MERVTYELGLPTVWAAILVIGQFEGPSAQFHSGRLKTALDSSQARFGMTRAPGAVPQISILQWGGRLRAGSHDFGVPVLRLMGEHD